MLEVSGTIISRRGSSSGGSSSSGNLVVVVGVVAAAAASPPPDFIESYTLSETTAKNWLRSQGLLCTCYLAQQRQKDTKLKQHLKVSMHVAHARAPHASPLHINTNTLNVRDSVAASQVAWHDYDQSRHCASLNSSPRRRARATKLEPDGMRAERGLTAKERGCCRHCGVC